MSYEEQLTHDIQSNQLNPDDTFQFSCRECGQCCRNRATPVMLTGLDIYRIAKGLDIDAYEVLSRYTTGYLGDISHAPVVVLRERMDGSCSLLRKGRCTAHSCKPLACAVHPIGRIIDLTAGKSIYIQQSGGCKGASEERIWTLSEWLDEWGLKELDAPSLAWNLMVGKVAEVMRKIDISDIGRDVIWELYQHMYGDYEPQRDFIEQVKENSEALRKYFQEKFKVKVEF